MSEGISDIVLPVFNDKIAYATRIGIKYGAYLANKELYKFIQDAYTCVAFNIFSFDGQNENEMFDCDEIEDDIKKSENEAPEYYPKFNSAQYLAIVKIIMTGNDDLDSAKKVANLTALLQPKPVESDDSDQNSEEIETRRLFSKDPVNDFMKFTEQCMNEELDDESLGSDETCKGYLGLGRNSNFDIITLSVKSSAPQIVVINQVTMAEKFVKALKYMIYVFVAICFVTSIAGKYYSKRIGSDNVKPFGILFFSLYTWDFYSDIMFCARLGDATEWALFTVSIVFIFVPWIMNIVQLFQAQKKWTTDETVQEGVRGWFVDWSILLVVAVCLSGNSFGAIELANV